MGGDAMGGGSRPLFYERYDLVFQVQKLMWLLRTEAAEPGTLERLITKGKVRGIYKSQLASSHWIGPLYLAG